MKRVVWQRIIRLGLVNAWRNRWLSAGAIVTLAFTLLAITSFIVTTVELRARVASIKDKIDLVAYFNDDIPDQEIIDLKLKLASRPDVKDVKYISKAEALKVFQTQATSKQIKQLVTPSNNPLPRSLQINPVDQDAYDRLQTLLSGSVYQAKIWRLSSEDNMPIIRSLNAQIAQETRNGYIFAAVFILIAFIVLINTLRIVMFYRRSEMEVMRLVGASNIYIRVPFLLEAAIYGLVGSLLAFALLLIGLKYNIPIIPSFISSIFVDTQLSSYALVMAHVWQILVFQVAVGIFITSLISMISVSRNLKI